MKKILSLIFCGCFIFAAFAAAAQDAAPLTLFQIERALRAAQVPLRERNRLLIEGVNQRGITFAYSPAALNKLIALGASKQLVEAIVAKAPTLPSLRQGSMNRDGNPINMRNTLDIEFVLIPKGEFMMGAKTDEAGSLANEKPRHKVNIKEHFYLGIYEVTQKQWKSVMGANPSRNKQCGEDCPVESVSWDEAQQFIKKLNEKDTLNYVYRLPSEAEWEYAARGGATTRYFWSDDEEEKMWRMYAHSNDKSTAPVGSYMPNVFGLYDTSGNVWELVEDVWHTDYGKTKADGSANTAGDPQERVMKGGSLSQYLDELRPARRGKISRDAKMTNVGFRLAAVYTGAAK